MAITLFESANFRPYRIAAIVAFIQFTNALEYMVFNPIFTFMAADFSVPITRAGYVTGVYTLAAVVSGIAAFFWADRVDKKRFLQLNMLTLGVLTGMITLTGDFSVLIVIRLLAGLAGGTTMGVGMGLLINAAPPELRSRMVALAIASFSLVSIVGMPVLMYISAACGWRQALWLIGIFCMLSVALVRFGVPSSPQITERHAGLALNREVLRFATANGIAQFSPMLLIPVLVPVMSLYMKVSDAQLPWIFFTGGIAGLIATKATGGLLHHFSATRVLCVSTVAFIASLALPFMLPGAAHLFMALFMATSYCRLVASSVVTLNYPQDRHRAGFGTLQTALMYLLTTAAYFLSSLLMSREDVSAGSLAMLMLVCGLSAALLPGYIWLLERRLALRKT